MTHSAASDLGVQCLDMFHKKDARLIWVMKHGLYTFIQIYDVVAKKASKPSTDTEYKNIS